MEVKIHEDDIRRVAKDEGFELTPKQVAFLVQLYPEYEEDCDGADDWVTVVEDMLYDHFPDQQKA